MDNDLSELIDQLRAQGGDTADIEVKTASGGIPESLNATLCAFANRPGGGLIILGLDERRNFEAVGVENPQQVIQQIASKARSRFVPPITIEAYPTSVVDGKKL